MKVPGPSGRTANSIVPLTPTAHRHHNQTECQLAAYHRDGISMTRVIYGGQLRSPET